MFPVAGLKQAVYVDAMDVSGEERQEPSLRKIIRVAENRLLKYGRSQNIELEAENMRYIAENTTIPIPHVHEIQIHDGGVKSILMDYIEGQTLQDAWSSMIPSQKISVAQELHGYIQQLRALKYEQSRPFSHKNIYTRHLIHLDEYLFSRLTTTVSDFVRNTTATKQPDDNIVFTHGDLAPRNILVDDHGHVTAVLDWELAGWQPEWCETVRAYTFCNDIPGWTAYLSAVFPPDHATEYMAVVFARHMKR
ncbi:hypothetical protein N7455_001978 [Penicillium solitum]|uniref:uncharacterized protein n=1 Tax=Penicillium solitum TaxID=60172 RepID=UPI0032C47E20|nr:hypothetical protein N7455_001978 [Penicillium solitum]